MEINAVQVEPFHSIQITHFGHGWNESPLELKNKTKQNGANSNQSIMKTNKQTNKEETIPKNCFILLSLSTCWMRERDAYRRYITAWNSEPTYVIYIWFLFLRETETQRGGNLKNPCITSLFCVVQLFWFPDRDSGEREIETRWRSRPCSVEDHNLPVRLYGWI